MEAVAPNALRGEFAGQCEFLRQRRLAAMECGVEAATCGIFGAIALIAPIALM